MRQLNRMMSRKPKTSEIHDVLAEFVSADKQSSLNSVYTKKIKDSIIPMITPVILGKASGISTGQLVQTASKFLPRAFGLNNSDAGLCQDFAGKSCINLAGREIENHFRRTHIKCVRNSQMKLLMKRYPATKLITQSLTCI